MLPRVIHNRGIYSQRIAIITIAVTTRVDPQARHDARLHIQAQWLCRQDIFMARRENRHQEVPCHQRTRTLCRILPVPSGAMWFIEVHPTACGFMYGTADSETRSTLNQSSNRRVPCSITQRRRCTKKPKACAPSQIPNMIISTHWKASKI